ncbi:transcriptional regulator [Halostagnicola sp. A-GB9-2]|uniref:HVO_A0114 family putative DNA-binding protein n=1 Tax=Halostagnicola sp. A-GB9-2 TaxID=3048066 RepID=UPI0024C00DB4|nr:transcriptional regulator [Halostagnicola sp. A-GB9-2]MDJ1432870.1 transcriptional regulator [Halostagnicola sp. A-GB9-2]
MEKTGNTNDDRTLHIRFRTGDEQRALETLRALDRGDEPEPFFEIVYSDPDDLARVVRPKNLELLRTIAQHDPKSIRDAARLVDRDVRQVHTNLEELEELRLIEFEKDGRAKKPTVWYDTIAVDLPLAHGTNANRDAADV